MTLLRQHFLRSHSQRSNHHLSERPGRHQGCLGLSCGASDPTHLERPMLRMLAHRPSDQQLRAASQPLPEGDDLRVVKGALLKAPAADHLETHRLRLHQGPDLPWVSVNKQLTKQPSHLFQLLKGSLTILCHSARHHARFHKHLEPSCEEPQAGRSRRMTAHLHLPQPLRSAGIPQRRHEERQQCLRLQQGRRQLPEVARLKQVLQRILPDRGRERTPTSQQPPRQTCQRSDRESSGALSTSMARSSAWQPQPMTSPRAGSLFGTCRIWEWT